MCTILFSWKKIPGYRLVLIANRDEFYERPTALAHYWVDYPEVLAGRDLQAGGTWLGITKTGRFAAITNYRKFPLEGPFETSRGNLVKDFLTSNESAASYFDKLKKIGNNYEGYNLIFGDANECYYQSNKGLSTYIKPNTYGLSNHLLDSPWPKVKNGKAEFIRQIKRGDLTKEHLFEILANEKKAKDSELPDTGVGLEKERMLSPIFIKSKNYGTRISTVLTINENGQVNFHERSFVPKKESDFSFKIS
jgi:uncharacterized protein with NRDE domain